MQAKENEVGRVKLLLKKFMDGKFILILMTMVTIFAIVGVSSLHLLTGLG